MSRWLYFGGVIVLIALGIYSKNWILMLNPILFFFTLIFLDLGDMEITKCVKKLDDLLKFCFSSIFSFGWIIGKLFLLLFIAFFVIDYLLCHFHVKDSCCFTNWICKHFQFVNNSNFGQIGDIFGGLTTPILTAFALYYTYKTYQTSVFEKIFYSYLEQNRNLCKIIKENDSLNSFEKMYEKFKDFYCKDLAVHLNKETITDDELTSSQKSVKKEVLKSLIVSSYEKFYYYKNNGSISNNETLGIYYRNLFQCIKFIHKSSCLTDNEKKEYAKILRTEMSDYAQLMLYYNSFSKRGNAWVECEDFNRLNLLVHYCLIQNIPKLDYYVGFEPAEYFNDKIDFEYKKIE